MAETILSFQEARPGWRAVFKVVHQNGRTLLEDDTPVTFWALVARDGDGADERVIVGFSGVPGKGARSVEAGSKHAFLGYLTPEETLRAWAERTGNVKWLGPLT